ncbi:MAG: CaiB/BaiF CoA-transferase family protein [Dehalococcoidia bacterium]
MSDGGTLAGIRVVELASWFMVPGCAGILASFGADVVKIEPAGSADPARYTRIPVDGEPIDVGFELVNNRKRSIQLDLSSDAGIEVIERLIGRADVFVTNVRAKSLERMGIAPEQVTERYPQLIYAHGTGYGAEGSIAGRPAFDELAYWSRGGIGAALQTDDSPPVQLYGAMGDLPSAVTLVGGIAMALYRREREGRGGIVDVSLYGAGLWTNGYAIAAALAGAPPGPQRGPRHRINPLYTAYRCADGRWVQFAMFQTDRFWDPLCEAIERPDLIDDERFNTHQLRIENGVQAFDELQAAIGTITRDELGPRLDEHDLPWSPIFDAADAAADEQARVNGYFPQKQHRSGTTIETVAPPLRLRDEPHQFGPAPEVGEHTEEVLLELGYEWDDIAALRERGAF